MDGHRTISWEAETDLEPDVLLPSQFFARPGGRPSTRPEGQLMRAVLEDAVASFQKHAMAQDHRGHRLFVEAAQWFASDDVAWPFSFVNICRVLDLDADFLRCGLRRWRDRRHAAGETRIVLRSPFRHVHGSGRAIGG